MTSSSYNLKAHAKLFCSITQFGGLLRAPVQLRPLLLVLTLFSAVKNGLLYEHYKSC